MTTVAEYGEVALGVECALPAEFLRKRAPPRLLPAFRRLILGPLHSRRGPNARPAQKAQRR